MGVKVEIVCDGCGRCDIRRKNTRNALMLIRDELRRRGWDCKHPRPKDYCPGCVRIRYGG